MGDNIFELNDDNGEEHRKQATAHFERVIEKFATEMKECRERYAGVGAGEKKTRDALIKSTVDKAFDTEITQIEQDD